MIPGIVAGRRRPTFSIEGVSTSLSLGTSSPRNIPIPAGAEPDDWSILFAGVRWDAAMTFSAFTAQKLATAGNAATGMTLRGAVVPYRHTSGMDGANLSIAAAGIATGLGGAILVVRGAPPTGGPRSTSSNDGDGGIPVFASVTATAGDLLVAATFFSNPSGTVVNNLGAGYTRQFNDDSTTGDDMRLVIDTHLVTATGTLTPVSPRSTSLSSSNLWHCVAIVIPGS